MWPYHPELLSTPVPRYTSYPTAADFIEGVGAKEMQQGLAAVGAGDAVSLYVHIPYCHEICWYCGCNTGAANRAQRLTSYLDALEAEIALACARLGGRGRVQRVAFGGGSPNAIAPDAFVRLLDSIRSAFVAADPIISVELDPRSFDEKWANTMAAARVTRASLGVQTLAPHVQQAIGRVQSAATIAAAVERLCRAGVTSLNFDLMYGLPQQSLDDLERTIAEAVAMGPDRIALFGYAHVPHIIPRQRRIEVAAFPDAAMRFAQAELGHGLLVQAGYVAIGFDHFARPSDPLALARESGTLRRNFQGFTDDPSPLLIGLGASAISCFPDRILQNEKNAGRYRMMMSAGRLAAVRGCMRSEEEQARGRIIENLLCYGEADLSELSSLELPQRLEQFLEAGLAEVRKGRLHIDPVALPYARGIAASFDSYREPQGQGFSSAI